MTTIGILDRPLMLDPDPERLKKRGGWNEHDVGATRDEDPRATVMVAALLVEELSITILIV